MNESTAVHITYIRRVTHKKEIDIIKIITNFLLKTYTFKNCNSCVINAQLFYFYQLLYNILLSINVLEIEI